MMRYLVIIVLALSLLFSGCARTHSQEQPQYECPDGRNVSDYTLCYNSSSGGEGNESAQNGTQQTNYGAEAGCLDMDGGKVLESRGTTTLGEDEEIDFCVDEVTLREYYCDSETIAYEEVRCPQGKKCINGRCVSESCWDSDGTNAYTRGAVHKGEAIYEDTCEDADTVKEYYCNGNATESKKIDCANGETCNAGRCVSEAPCTDSDGGKDRNVQGVTSYGGSSYTDKCVSGGKVEEFFCDEMGINSVKLVCGAGYECSNGACVASPCVDSDGGSVSDERGTARKGSEEKEDICIDTDTLKEYFCESGEISYEKIDCPSDTQCVDGECIELECTSEEEEFSEENVLYEIASLSGTIRLYENETLEVDNGMFLRVDGISGDHLVLSLYGTYLDFPDNPICSSGARDDEVTDLCSELWFDDEDADYDNLEFEVDTTKNLSIVNGTGETCNLYYQNAVEITTSEEFKLQATWEGFDPEVMKKGKKFYYIPSHNVSGGGTDCDFGWGTTNANPSPLIVLKDTDNDYFAFDFYDNSVDYLAIRYPHAGEQGYITIYGPTETDSGNDEIWLVENAGDGNAGEWDGAEIVSAMGVQIALKSDYPEFQLKEALVEENPDKDYTAFLLGEAGDVDGNGDILSARTDGYNRHLLIEDEEIYRYMNGFRYEEGFISPRGTQFRSGDSGKFQFKVPDMVLNYTITSHEVVLKIEDIRTDKSYVDVQLVDGAHISQYTRSEGINIDWTDLAGCEEDETKYYKQTMYFYPRLDTTSSGVNLDGETFSLLGEEAVLLGVDFEDQRLQFKLSGQTIEIKEYYNTFEFEGDSYNVELTFGEMGLAKMVVQLD